MADVKEVRAIARGVQMSPRKVALVASLVRGRTVADALVILSHTPKRAAKPVVKAIASAQANATNNHKLDGKTLVIKHLQVTPGARLKRFRAAAMGRALPFQKKSSHISVIVEGVEKVKKPAAEKAAAKTNEPAAKKPVAKKKEQ